MKNRTTLKAVLATSGVFIIIISAMIYLYLKDPQRNYLYIDTKKYIEGLAINKNVTAGYVIGENDIKKIKLEVNSIDSINLIATKKKDVLGKKTLYPLNKGQIIYTNHILSEEKWYNGRTPFAIEVDVKTTIADSIEIGDFINVAVSYNSKYQHLNSGKYKNFDYVITKVMVEDIKDGAAQSRKEESEKEKITPRYLVLSLTDEEIDRYLDAIKYGQIFITLCTDKTQELPNVTYTIKNNNSQNNETYKNMESVNNE